MSAYAPLSAVALTSAEIAELAARLDPVTAGYALKLIALQAELGRGIPDATIHHRLGIQRRTWTAVAAKLSNVFDCADGVWIYAPLARRQDSFRAFQEKKREAHRRSWKKRRQPSGSLPKPQEKDAARAAPAGDPSEASPKAEAPQAIPAQAPVLSPPPLPPSPLPSALPPPAVARPMRKTRRGQTLDLFEAQGLPRVAAGEALPSLKAHAIQMGIVLLTNAGRSESAARAALARLMQDWDDGYVAMAINATWKQRENIADPYSRLRYHLKKYPTREQERQAEKAGKPVEPKTRRSAHPPPVANSLGLSQGLMKRIADKNRSLKRFVDTVPPGTGTNS